MIPDQWLMWREVARLWGEHHGRPIIAMKLFDASRPEEFKQGFGYMDYQITVSMIRCVLEQMEGHTDGE